MQANSVTPISTPELGTWSAVGEAPPTVLVSGTPGAQPLRMTENFGHSDDYGVLVGLVQPFRHGWRLRYATFDAEDQHGGCVILEGGDTNGLQDGCQVRVEGKIIPSPDRNGTPTFQVQTLDIFKR